MQITKSTTKEHAIELSKVDCKDCTHCCKFGSGIVLTEEIKGLAEHFKIEEKEFKEKYLKGFQNFNTAHFKFKTVESEKPYGQCILLTEKGCSIHDIKPLHCRIGSCNLHGEELNIWFTVNHFVNPYDPNSVREWASYIRLGNKTIAGTKLEEMLPDKEVLDKIMKFEILR